VSETLTKTRATRWHATLGLFCSIVWVGIAMRELSDAEWPAAIACFVLGFLNWHQGLKDLHRAWFGVEKDESPR